MKTIKPVTICTFLLSLCIQAQDIKHQSEIIRNNVAKGDYRIIADLYKSHRGVVNIADIKRNRDQPNSHFEIHLKKYPNHASESKRNTAYKYFPDNLAFPVTYFAGSFQGNKKLQEQVGYVIREYRDPADDRIVFVDDYLFMLQKWKSKDNYEVRWILKAPKAEKEKAESKTKTKKKKNGFFKSLKKKFNNAKPLSSNISIEKIKAEVLQPYLDAATKKQEAYYASWIKKPENAKTKKYIDDKRAMMKKAIKQYNDDIFNSPEYQRMLAYQKWIDNSINMTVHNKSGSTIWVGSSATAFITNEISSGSSSTQTCTSDMYYYLSDAKGAKGYKFYTADSSCGSSVTIN